MIKDLVLNGQIKVNFWLTKEEQIKIQSMVCETNFFLIHDTILNTAPVEITSNFIHFLKIKINNEENSVIWNYILPEFQTDQYNKLIELSDYIVNVIESKPEYRSLPPRNGGYD